VADVRSWARGATGLFAGTLGKAPGHVLRLAMVLEYLSWSQLLWQREPSEISASALQGAIRLIDSYFIPMAQRVFGEAAIPLEDQLGMELARWIIRADPKIFNARETRRKIRGSLSDSKAMQQACDALSHAGWIRPMRRNPEPGAGRTPLNFEVNPKLRSEVKACG
jgi:hypothetical protein